MVHRENGDILRTVKYILKHPPFWKLSPSPLHMAFIDLHYMIYLNIFFSF